VNELIDIANLKVISGNPASREDELFLELAELEAEHGEYFGQQQRDSFA